MGHMQLLTRISWLEAQLFAPLFLTKESLNCWMSFSKILLSPWPLVHWLLACQSKKRQLYVFATRRHSFCSKFSICLAPRHRSCSPPVLDNQFENHCSQNFLTYVFMRWNPSEQHLPCACRYFPVCRELHPSQIILFSPVLPPVRGAGQW